MSRLLVIVMGVAALALAACGVPESSRLDLGPGLVVAFVKSQSAERPGKVAYVTHVPSGSQAVVASDGWVIKRHDGRGDGPSRLEAVLGNAVTMERIMRGMQSDAQPRSNRRAMIDWVPLIQFGGIKYVLNWHTDDGTLTGEDLTEIYRVAFKVNGHAGLGYRVQDGDATYLSPGTPVYVVKDYSPAFRLGIVQDGTVTIYEASTNPDARIGADLLDIRGKVTAIDILSEEDADTVLGTIDEPLAIDRFVEAILASPVDRRRRDHEGERYFLGFRLVDGTSVVRSFWLESGELHRDIMTDPTVTQSVRSAVAP